MSDALVFFGYTLGGALTVGIVTAWFHYEEETSRHRDSFDDGMVTIIAGIFWPAGLPAFLAYKGAAMLGTRFGEAAVERREAEKERERELERIIREHKL